MQLRRTHAPFGEVNVYPCPRDPKKVSVNALVPLGVCKEGAQTGLALDASGSMESSYADFTGRGNAITPVAREICAYLAGHIDQDGGTTSIYWALGRAGTETQVIGDLTSEQVATHRFVRPTHLGGDTALLPAVKYFVERFHDAPWGLYVFLTDGKFSDLAAVVKYSKSLVEQIKAGKRNPVKLVLVGVGSGVDASQMKTLDDLSNGTDLPDLWDHKLASDMASVSAVTAEVIDENARIAKSGTVLAPDGTMLKNYTDTGVPCRIQFDAPASTPYFRLVADGRNFYQPLTDDSTVSVPLSDPETPATPGVAPGTNFAKELAPAGANAQPERQNKATQTPTGEITAFDVTDAGRGLSTEFDVGKQIKNDVDLGGKT